MSVSDDNGQVTVMVCARDVWMQAGIEQAVRDVWPDADIVPDGRLPDGALTCIVCWLPPLSEGLAESLLSLAGVLRHAPPGSRTLLLSRALPGWFWRTLSNLVRGPHRILRGIQVVCDQVTPEELSMLLSGACPAGVPVQTMRGLYGQPPGLSAAELLVLGAALRGEAMQQVAAREGRPVGRLYRLRWQAMEKLGGLRIKNLRYPPGGRTRR